MREFRSEIFGEAASRHLLSQGGVDLLWWMLVCQIVVSSLAQSNAPGYMGCFVDSGDRALNGGSRTFDSLTVQRCFKHCQDDTLVKFKYAGLEYQEECYCGNEENYERHGKAKESNCHKYTCTGNSNQFCGGDWRISIYKISLGACSDAIGPPAHGTNSITNPPGLSYNLDDYKFLGTRVNFVCDTDYVLDGSPAIECIQDGNTAKWNDSVPACKALEPTTIPTTTLATTTSITSTTGRITNTSLAATTAALSSTEATPTKARQTHSVDTVSLIGIVIGALAAVVIGLAFVILICRKRGSKKREPATVVNDKMGVSFSNNMYEITVPPTQGEAGVAPQSDQDATGPLYSEVARKQSRGGKADLTANYVNTVILPTPGTQENGRESGLVDNVLYESSSFKDESEMAGQDSDGQQEPFTTMKGQPGWVENNIYE